MQQHDTPGHSAGSQLHQEMLAHTCTTRTPSIQQRALAFVAHPAVALVLIMLLAVALRLYKLDYRDYWDDEIVSTIASRPPLVDIFQSLSHYSIHPPFYYMLLHGWMALGEDLVTLRLLSVLIGTVSVLLTYLLGRTLVSHPVGLVAAGLMALSPFQVFHGQQARMYPLLTLLIIVATLLFLWAWRHGGWYRWLAFALCVTAGFYTHVYFPFSLLAFDVWALYSTRQAGRIDRSRWAGLVLAQALGAAAFLPFLPQLLNTTGDVISWFWIRPNTPFDWLLALVSLSNHATFAMRPDTPAWYLLLTFFPAVAAVLLTLIYSLREARRHPDERTIWVLLHCLIWTPIVVATLISLTVKPILVDRYLGGLSVPLYLLMAWMFLRYWRKRTLQVVAGVFVASCLATLAYAYPETRQQSAMLRLVNAVAEQRQPGDAVVYTDFQALDASLLMHPEQQHTYIAPGRSNWANAAYWTDRIAYMRWQHPPGIAPVEAFAPRYERVWLVLTLYGPDLPYHQQVSQQWLEDHGRLVQTTDFERGVAFLYELTSP